MRGLLNAIFLLGVPCCSFFSVCSRCNGSAQIAAETYGFASSGILRIRFIAQLIKA
jgi:hypothetical protein